MCAGHVGRIFPWWRRARNILHPANGNIYAPVFTPLGGVITRLQVQQITPHTSHGVDLAIIDAWAIAVRN